MRYPVWCYFLTSSRVSDTQLCCPLHFLPLASLHFFHCLPFPLSPLPPTPPPLPHMFRLSTSEIPSQRSTLVTSLAKAMSQSDILNSTLSSFGACLLQELSMNLSIQSKSSPEKAMIFEYSSPSYQKYLLSIYTPLQRDTVLCSFKIYYLLFRLQRRCTREEKTTKKRKKRRKDCGNFPKIEVNQ